MWTANRYCSPTSCSGQSEATHSSATPAQKKRFWRRLIGG